MKIAVYTVALNEEQFIERWFNSAKDADYLLIADTGSSDKTVEKAKQLGINCFVVSINPWRFDDARNAALALIPSDIDYCISLDMDEVLSKGWREELEKISSETNRPVHKLVSSWNEDGTPAMEFDAIRIHSRKNYRWKYPIHEIPTPYAIKEIRENTKIEIHHHPDKFKSRKQYLPLLALATQEDPSSDRNAFYYGRELYYHQLYKEAIDEFKRHLLLPTAWWKPERCESMRYIAKCGDPEAESWLKKACEEAPERREPFVDLAEFYYRKSMWTESKEYAEKALNITEKNLGYFCESDAWGYKPNDLLAIASYKLGLFEDAVKYGQIACDFSPEERLKTNLAYYNASNV